MVDKEGVAEGDGCECRVYGLGGSEGRRRGEGR